jgi:mannose/fructose-specific phosphotransferase system component IIA
LGGSLKRFFQFVNMRIPNGLNLLLLLKVFCRKTAARNTEGRSEAAEIQSEATTSYDLAELYG